MKILTALPLMAGLLFTGCNKENSADSNKSKPHRSSTSGGNPITAPVDYLGAAAKAHKTATAKVAGAGLDQTIKVFYAQEGRFPKDLNELVSPEYLNAIPPPPAGMRYDYNAKTGELKVLPK
ncbi:MAG: hypothetical protein QOF48_3220 [Verrucomicrobiota bacterium]|jgi:hypothetical protein